MSRLKKHLEENALLLNFTSLLQCVFGPPAHQKAFIDTTAKHVRLFGSAGHNAQHLFLSSIKYHTWLLVLALTFGLQVVLTDLAALWDHGWANSPVSVGSELILFGTISVLNLVILLRLIPFTMSTYTLVTTVEGFRQDWAIVNVCKKNHWQKPALPRNDKDRKCQLF